MLLFCSFFALLFVFFIISVEMGCLGTKNQNKYKPEEDIHPNDKTNQEVHSQKHNRKIDIEEKPKSIIHS